MGLRGELDLDVGAIGQSLLSALGGPLTALQGVEPPLTGDGLDGAADGMGDLDTGGVSGAVGAVAGQAQALLSALPVAGDLLQPLTAGLSLVRQLGEGDLGERLTTLATRLSAELEGELDAGIIQAVLRIASILSSAPEGTLLLELIRALAGDNAAIPRRVPIADTLQAADVGLRALAGLMSLESLLAESERLTQAMAAAYDGERLQLDLTQIGDLLDGGGSGLADFIAAVEATSPAEVDAALVAIQALAAQLEATIERIAAAMGAGEATLVYLDVDAVQTEMGEAAAFVRNATLNPLTRLVEQIAGFVNPLLAFDLGGMGARAVDGLLDEVEGRIAPIADRIGAVDLAGFVEPLTDGLQFVADLFGRVAEVINGVVVTFRGAMEQVRDAIAALPIQPIADAIRQFLEPIAAVVDRVREAIEAIEAALDVAVTATSDAIGQVDAALDAFKSGIDELFEGARTTVERFDIDQLVGTVSANIQAFADLVAKAQMKPYFDTVNGAIGTAADVVDAVPFDLLPDSMEAEVEAAVQPVKAIDVREVERRIESLLQIEDGKFALRDDLEASIAEIQAQYESLVAWIREKDPRLALEAVEEKLDEVAARVREIDPALTLEPIQSVVNDIKDAVGSFDIDALLDPIREVFTQIEQAIDEYSPAALIEPIERELDEVREQVVAQIKLDEWGPTLDDLEQRAVDVLDVLDPAQLEGQLRSAFEELDTIVRVFPQARASGSFGQMVLSLLRGIGLRVSASSFDVVLRWLVDGESGTRWLTDRTGRVEAAVRATREAVEAVNLGALGNSLASRLDAVAGAARNLAAQLPADSDIRAALEAAAPRLDAAGAFGVLEANRARYLAALQRSAGFADALRRQGLSEVDVTVAALRGVVAPLGAARDKINELLSLVGLAPGGGVAGVVRTILAAAPPQRLAALFTPITEAIESRLEALLDAVIDPLKDGIDNIRAVVDAIDLTPLREAMQLVVDEIKGQIAALHPDALLGPSIAAVEVLQTTLIEADPVAAVTEMLTHLRDLIDAVLHKADLDKLLESPLAIYDHILAELDKLNLEGLLDPVFDQLDDIAQQVDVGLDETVVAFERLQGALP